MSLSIFNLPNLKCIQNSAARIVTNTSGYTTITPVYDEMQWMLVYPSLPLFQSYNARWSQSDGKLLVAEHFCSSFHRSTKQSVAVLLSVCI